MTLTLEGCQEDYTSEPGFLKVLIYSRELSW